MKSFTDFCYARTTTLKPSIKSSHNCPKCHIDLLQALWCCCPYICFSCIILLFSKLFICTTTSLLNIRSLSCSPPCLHDVPMFNYFVNLLTNYKNGLELMKEVCTWPQDTWQRLAQHVPKVDSDHIWACKEQVLKTDRYMTWSQSKIPGEVDNDSHFQQNDPEYLKLNQNQTPQLLSHICYMPQIGEHTCLHLFVHISMTSYAFS